MEKPNFGDLRPIGNNRFYIDMVCPRCGAFTQAEGGLLNTTSLAVLCYRCEQAVLIMFSQVITPGAPASAIEDYYPKRSVTADPHIPDDIAHDYLEAQRCFLVGAWHGCAVMARRCMHSVAEHFKAAGRDLYEQINDLKDRRLITPVLAEQAQHVRVLGKHGAHPFDTRGNELKQLGMDDAQAALEFCDFIFDQVFIQPKKIEASKARLKPPTP